MGRVEKRVESASFYLSIKKCKPSKTSEQINVQRVNREWKRQERDKF